MATETITIFSFLEKLRLNNNREWFTENKLLYEQAKMQADELFATIFNEFKAVDDTLDNYKSYRIYRDVRFSTDKTPYKTHFGMFINRIKPDYRGGYYLHIEPNNTFLGIGFYGPNKEDLLRIRKEIELDAELEQILADKTIKKYFDALQGDEVKTAPKGFDKNHPRINLIKKKQFYLTHQFENIDVLKTTFPQEVVKTFKAADGFLAYMTDVLLTNLNGEKI